MPLDFKTKLIGKFSRYSNKSNITNRNTLNFDRQRITFIYLPPTRLQFCIDNINTSSHARSIHHKSLHITLNVDYISKRRLGEILTNAFCRPHPQFVTFGNQIAARTHNKHCLGSGFLFYIPTIKTWEIARYTQTALPRRMTCKWMRRIISKYKKWRTSRYVEHGKSAKFLIGNACSKFMQCAPMRNKTRVIFRSSISTVAIFITSGRVKAYIHILPIRI